MAIPDNSPPVSEPLPSDDQRRIVQGESKWTDDNALRIVRSDWAYAETFRVNAHDWRYRNSDELYLAWAGQRYWEGTRVPRSSLGVYAVFEQVEAMLPKIVSMVTAIDSFHFTADQPGGGDEQDLAVQAWRELVLTQLDEINFRQQVVDAIKNMEIYGNGVLEVGMEQYEEEYIQFKKQTQGIPMQQMPGQLQTQAFSGTQESFKRDIKREKKMRPYVRYISIKDLYVDPNLECHSLQQAGYIIKRVYMRAEQIKALKGQKGFRIPNDDYLTQLSHTKSTANQDVTKLAPELFRYNMWNPGQDYTSDPSQKRIAVVEYTTKDRKIWWLQGAEESQSIIYNEPNRYGGINYYSVGYADVPDRWHALSVADVAEGEQRLQQAIINSRVDELALALHPPQLKRRGVTIPWYQLKRAPGRVVEVENPESDIKEAEIHNITQQAFVEVAASENRVQRLTGLTDLAALGAPSSGGNSANRTATGVNVQAGATADRMKFIVENVESGLIEPVVNAIINMNRKFADLKHVSNWLKIDPRFQKLDPEMVMNTKVSAECRASMKMAGKASFMQNFPLLMQTFMNPEFVQMLAQVNKKTLDPDAVERTLWDAVSYTPREKWFIPMSPEQIQAQQQPPPEAMLQMQMQQMQNQSDDQMNQRNLQTKLIDTLLKESMESHRHHAELDDTHVQELSKLSVQRETNQQQSKDAAEDRKLQASALTKRGAGSSGSKSK